MLFLAIIFIPVICFIIFNLTQKEFNEQNKIEYKHYHKTWFNPMRSDQLLYKPRFKKDPTPYLIVFNGWIDAHRYTVEQVEAFVKEDEGKVFNIDSDFTPWSVIESSWAITNL